MQQYNKGDLMEDVTKILSGKYPVYGTIEIELIPISDTVLWIGMDGYTSSIGQWIRKVQELRREGYYIIGFEQWKIPMGDNQNHIYFGAEMLKEGDQTQQIHHIICGGATDYSGEGSHGKALAETYIHLTGIQELNERTGDDLIRLLTEKRQSRKKEE
jgi:hypothetical protein